MKIYAASCNCRDCRESGWRVPQWILPLPEGKGDIVLYGVPGPTAEYGP